jgi:hypothetical protein
MRLEVEAKYLPRLTAWHIRKILKWVEPDGLRGLECIRIMDYEPEDPDASKHPPYLTGFLYNGAYLRKKNDRPAAIALYTRDLYFPIPRLLVASPVARFRIASKFAHELGHHAIAAHGFRSANKAEGKRARDQLVDPAKEAAADEYAGDVIRKMVSSSLYYKVGRILTDTLSSIMFEVGNRAHWKGDFRRAARLEFRAYVLNRENSDAGQSYLLDRTALLKKPSLLTDDERLWLRHRRVASDR